MRKNTHGGPRPGAGRPRKKQKAIKVTITLSPEHYEVTTGPRGFRSKVIAEALELLIQMNKPCDDHEQYY